MLKEITYPAEYSFTGNPMLVTLAGDASEEIILEVEAGGKHVIDLSLVLLDRNGQYEGSIDIAGILTSFFKKFYYGTGLPVAPLKDFYVDYTINLRNYPDAAFNKFTGKAFYGGISEENYARLQSWGWDMFRYRLANYERQFLFTTRTNSNHLVLRESELYPFVFLHPGKPISIITSSAKVLIPDVHPENTVCTLDMEAVRNIISQAYNELPSFFAVAVGGLTLFDISIVPGQISDENYILRFRNSLGAYEQIEITGSATDQTTFSEEKLWMSRNNRYNYFEEKRNRVISRKGLMVNTGYKTKEDLAFIVDMIKSDEIYFIDMADPMQRERRCHIIPEEQKILRQKVLPQSIALKIRFVTDDIFESPEIILDYPSRLFQNITAQGKPEIEGDGFIYADDFAFYAD
jgi:predicted Zn-dependent protease with MMP-like domain